MPVDMRSSTEGIQIFILGGNLFGENYLFAETVVS